MFTHDSAMKSSLLLPHPACPSSLTRLTLTLSPSSSLSHLHLITLLVLSPSPLHHCLPPPSLTLSQPHSCTLPTLTFTLSPSPLAPGSPSPHKGATLAVQSTNRKQVTSVLRHGLPSRLAALPPCSSEGCPASGGHLLDT